MPSLLFASDSFKGSISSTRASELLSLVAHDEWAQVDLRSVAVADGGEGTVEALVNALGGELVHVMVKNPCGADIQASYGLLSNGGAIIEMAAASGLPLLSANERDPRLTSTFGTGQLIADALDKGVADISLAIGGSATNDGGMGAMRALGARFLDADERELAGRGKDLIRVRSIDLSGMDERVSQVHFHVMCDVDNPLVGPQGASCVFGPQKGADEVVVAELEEGMKSYSSVLAKTFGIDVSGDPGAGAAGGLGAAVRLFLGADMVSGIEYVLDLVHFDELLKGVDVCITGEGHADGQSVRGKVISGVARRCNRHGVPCVALVGSMDSSATILLEHGVSALVPTVIECGSVEEAMRYAEQNYILAAKRIFSLLKIGTQLT